MKKTDIIKSAQGRVYDFRRLQKEEFIPLDGNFFPCVHYPPITMYSPITEEELFHGYQNPPDNLFDIYVHVPFCIRYCTFCHYPVRIGASDEEKDYYLRMLEKEMDIYKKRLGLKTVHVRSILVGGGTPTYLTPKAFARFFYSLTSKLDLSACTQFSFDVDPLTLLGTEGEERLKIMRSYGVDRLTIGTQSFNDEILRRMNRPHNTAEAVKSIEVSRKSGFKINIEFIYGFPGQTLESWYEVMEKAVNLGVEEIQLYRLKIIPYGDHTGAIARIFPQRRNEFPPLEDVITMKQMAILILAENGYKENLRRVFTKNSEDYSHYADNQCCKLYDQIGFGLTAFSSLRDRFALNTQNIKEYYGLIKQNKLPINRGLIRNEDDQLRWCLLLPLKNREVYKRVYQILTGKSLNKTFRKKIDKMKKFALLYEDDRILKLTSLGAFFADEVCYQFYHPRYMTSPKKTFVSGH